ncbi:MAG: hypothetical protein DCC65_09860 [Planctomycetota bacterium]|nr:MAG: hypothetical protein DCC65_09860 [Planctomycetota bacterium]
MAHTTQPAAKPQARDVPDDNPSPLTRRLAWIRRLGVVGFLFFLIKGLAWLAVPALLAKRAID